MCHITSQKQYLCQIIHLHIKKKKGEGKNLNSKTCLRLLLRQISLQSSANLRCLIYHVMWTGCSHVPKSITININKIICQLLIISLCWYRLVWWPTVQDISHPCESFISPGHACNVQIFTEIIFQLCLSRVVEKLNRS